MTGWLMPAVGMESAVSREIADAAEAISALGVAVDGARWLSTAPFSEVQFGILFVKGGDGKPTFRQRREVLMIDTAVDPGALPDLDHVGYQWYFFNFALDTLNDVGRRYDLPVPPPLNLMPFAQFGNTDGMTPVSPGGAAHGIAAELAALEDDEVLVVALTASEDRLREIDAKIERSLGPITASSSGGNGGRLWAVAVEPDAGIRWGRRGGSGRPWRRGGPAR